MKKLMLLALAMGIVAVDAAPKRKPAAKKKVTIVTPSEEAGTPRVEAPAVEAPAPAPAEARVGQFDDVAPVSPSYFDQAQAFAKDEVLGTTYGRSGMLATAVAAAYGTSALYHKVVKNDPTPCKTAALAPVNTVKAWVNGKNYVKLASAVLCTSLVAAVAADFVVNGTDMTYAKAAYQSAVELAAHVAARCQTAEAAAPAPEAEAV